MPFLALLAFLYGNHSAEIAKNGVDSSLVSVLEHMINAQGGMADHIFALLLRARNQLEYLELLVDMAGEAILAESMAAPHGEEIFCG